MKDIYLKYILIARNGILKIVLTSIKLYKFVSVIFPLSCRYYPSCSEYSKDAFLKYGLYKGLVLSIKRLFRCNPVSSGGYDPVK